MEKNFLTGKTPDGRWLVTVFVDLDTKEKTKRFHFEEVKPATDPIKPPEDPEFPEGVGDLLI